MSPNIMVYLEISIVAMIGRKTEIQKIKQLLNSKRSEFLAITGRRRVGKTFLIDEVLSQYYCFNITGIQNGNTDVQLMNFSLKLAEYKKKELSSVPINWQMAFQEFRLYLKSLDKTLDKTQKQVIFIDELPWVYTARSNFIQLLAHLWNDYLSKQSHFLLERISKQGRFSLCISNEVTVQYVCNTTRQRTQLL